MTRISDPNLGKFLEEGAKNHMSVDCDSPMDFSKKRERKKESKKNSEKSKNECLCTTTFRDTAFRKNLFLSIFARKSLIFKKPLEYV